MPSLARDDQVLVGDALGPTPGLDLRRRLFGRQRLFASGALTLPVRCSVSRRLLSDGDIHSNVA